MITWFDRWGLPLMALVAAALGAALTAAVLVPHYEARIATMERDQATAIAQARSADVDALQAAKLHGDALTLRLQTTETTLATKETELRHAIALQTTGRACLSGSVVRLLNSASSIDTPSVPTPAAVSAATDGAAATNTADAAGYTSDTDIAQWASTARTQYDICRARLHALIDFSTNPTAIPHD